MGGAGSVLLSSVGAASTTPGRWFLAVQVHAGVLVLGLAWWTAHFPVLSMGVPREVRNQSENSESAPHPIWSGESDAHLASVSVPASALAPQGELSALPSASKDWVSHSEPLLGREPA